MTIAALSACIMSSTSARADDVLPPQISHEPCELYQKGEPFEVRARFYDDSPIFDPKVLYRTRRDGNWKAAPFARAEGSDDFTAVIPVRDLKGPVEYFIEAFDENGNGPAQYGNPDAPLRVRGSDDAPACVQIPATEDAPLRTVDAPRQDEPLGITEGAAPPPAASGCSAPNPPLYCSGWLWGSVGAVAVLGGGFLVYWFAIRAENEPPTRPDFITLTVTGDDPTVGLGP